MQETTELTISANLSWISITAYMQKFQRIISKMRIDLQGLYWHLFLTKLQPINIMDILFPSDPRYYWSSPRLGAIPDPLPSSEDFRSIADGITNHYLGFLVKARSVKADKEWIKKVKLHNQSRASHHCKMLLGIRYRTLIAMKRFTNFHFINCQYEKSHKRWYCYCYRSMT